MIFQSFKMAWQAIVSNKMRSFLTMLGIIIGVTALVVMVSLVNGATNNVQKEIESLGTDMLSVYIFNDKGDPMQISDLNDLAEDATVGSVAPLENAQLTAQSGNRSASVTMYGTTSSFFDIRGYQLESGRFLRTPDVDNSVYVTVLSGSTAKKLFGRTDVVGESLRIGGRSFQVVGVLADNSLLSGMSYEYDLYVPFSVKSRMTGSSGIHMFYVSAADPSDSKATETFINKVLGKRYPVDAVTGGECFMVNNASEIMESLSSVTGVMQLLLGGIAAISLLVGGIGIMNIMLVSVTERTREIGIRKAIGAGRGSIMLQFLIEALTVSLLGCLIGLMLSLGLLKIAEQAAAYFIQGQGASMSFAVTAPVALLAVGFSTAIGLLFGIYPANKAAKLPPIEALRYQ